MNFKECFFQRFPLHNLKTVVSKPAKENATKAQSIFVPEVLKDKEGDVIAELHYLYHLPILTFYTADPILKAQAQAKLTARYMIDLYDSFIQFLPLAANVKSGEFKVDPIKFVGVEIRRRKLNFDYVEVELHYMLIEFNAYILELNKKAYSGLTHRTFTMDDLKAFLALCDVYKGIGCSAALRTTADKEFEFIRNLDWEPLNRLGDHTLGVMSYTGHGDLNKPQMVFSIGFTPGILGLSVVNDKGLIITLNEATKMKTKRENAKPNAIPQFILARQLIENCVTLEDVEKYLVDHQPATSHILSVMDAYGNYGVFEMLPNVGPFSNDLYHLRRPQFGRLHVSNHFLDDNDNPLKGSEGFDCSFERFKNMGNALSNHEDALRVASSTNVHDSIQTLIFKRQADILKMSLNWSNSYSATAINSITGKLQYTDINLTEEFAIYAQRLAKQGLKGTAMPKIHQNLIRLMQSSHELGSIHPELGYYLSCYYSELVTLHANKNTIDSEINKATVDMLELIDAIQNDRRFNSQEGLSHDKNGFNYEIWGVLVLLAPLLDYRLSFVISVLALAYNYNETLTNYASGKSNELILREKILNEMQKILGDTTNSLTLVSIQK